MDLKDALRTLHYNRCFIEFIYSGFRTIVDITIYHDNGDKYSLAEISHEAVDYLGVDVFNPKNYEEAIKENYAWDKLGRNKEEVYKAIETISQYFKWSEDTERTIQGNLDIEYRISEINNNLKDYRFYEERYAVYGLSDREYEYFGFLEKKIAEQIEELSLKVKEIENGKNKEKAI